MYVVITGLSSIGKNLAELLSKEGHGVAVIDSDTAKCAEMAASSDMMVITGDATQRSTLEDAKAKNANALVAVTGDDSDNLMTCMLAKEMGVKKVISILNDVVHADAFKSAGIDVQIKPSAVVAKHIHRMISQPYVRDFLSFERAELFEIEVEEGMKCVNRKASEMGTPNGTRILVVERGGKYLNEDAQIEPGDWLTLIVNHESSKKGVAFMNKWFTKG